MTTLTSRRIRTRTHCPHGHAFTPENTRWTKQGWRRCRTCDRANAKRTADRYRQRAPIRRREAADAVLIERHCRAYPDHERRDWIEARLRPFLANWHAEHG